MALSLLTSVALVAVTDVCADEQHGNAYAVTAVGASSKIYVYQSSDGSYSASFATSPQSDHQSVLVDTDANDKIWIGGSVGDLYIYKKSDRTLLASVCLESPTNNVHAACLTTDHVWVLLPEAQKIVKLNRSGTSSVSSSFTISGIPFAACALGNYVYVALDSFYRYFFR